MGEIRKGFWRITAKSIPSPAAYLELQRALGFGVDVTHETIERIPEPHRSSIMKQSQWLCATPEEYNKLAEANLAANANSEPDDTK